MWVLLYCYTRIHVPRTSATITDLRPFQQQVQAEHDTRGFTAVPSPDEGLAEQVRRQNQLSGTGPQRENSAYAQSTRSRERLLQGVVNNEYAYVHSPKRGTRDMHVM